MIAPGMLNAMKVAKFRPVDRPESFSKVLEIANVFKLFTFF